MFPRAADRYPGADRVCRAGRIGGRKNAILIVEFAHQPREEGKLIGRGRGLCPRAPVCGPILMTSLAFLLGVAPLVRGDRCRARKLRQLLGTAVFGGMLV